MRISDWSSDMCSSDLLAHCRGLRAQDPQRQLIGRERGVGFGLGELVRGAICVREVGTQTDHRRAIRHRREADRKSVVEGKSVSVRVDIGVRGIIKKKKHFISKTSK